MSVLVPKRWVMRLHRLPKLCSRVVTRARKTMRKRPGRGSGAIMGGAADRGRGGVESGVAVVRAEAC